MADLAKTEAQRVGTAAGPSLLAQELPPAGVSPRMISAFLRYPKELEGGKHPLGLTIVCVAAVLLIGIGDLRTPPEVTFSIFYLLPVSLAAWFVGKVHGTLVATLAALVWCFAEIHTTPTPQVWVHLWNAFARLVVFLFIVFALAKLRKLQAGLHDMVRERTSQLQAEIAQRLELEHEIAALSRRERQRIGRELHDGLGQYLTGIAFRAKALEQGLESEGITRAAEAKELTGLITEAIHEARSLARGLDPIEVENTGLVGALEGLAADTQRRFEVSCQFKQQEPIPNVPTAASLTLFRIAQEAVHNAVKHSRPSRLQIDLAMLPQGLSLRVRDDGSGFDPAVQRTAGMGLRIMEYRARELGGSLTVSSAPGAGTCVDCLLPSGSLAPAPAVPADETATRARAPDTH